MAGFMYLTDNNGDVRELVEDDTLVFEQGGTETPDGRKLVVTIKDGRMGADEGELDFASADGGDAYYSHDGSVDYLLGTSTLDAHTSSDFFLV